MTIWEKSRGLGGRVATRRLESGVAFDHGAQYFTVNDAAFRARVDGWCQDGVTSIWNGRIVVLKDSGVAQLKEPRDRYVGRPGMSAIAKSLATGLDVRLNIKIDGASRQDRTWQIRDNAGSTFGSFDWLISTAPPAQTMTLLGPHSVPLANSLAHVEMDPCWAVMLQTKSPVDVNFDAAFVHDSSLSWIARNTSKPDRLAENCWVLHASPGWSRDHVDDAVESVMADLVNEFWKVIGSAPQRTVEVISHRWLYALPQKPLPTKFLLDEATNLAACGDWCDGPKIEGAFLSGRALANQLLQQL